MGTDRKSGPQEAIRGIIEGAIGNAKQLVGTILGRGDVVREGEAQQDKADAQRNAAKNELSAQSARGAAKAAEKRQQSHQKK
jgi:uncharacterized protein YjbJ (UPF0337 family)